MNIKAILRTEGRLIVNFKNSPDAFTISNRISDAITKCRINVFGQFIMIT